eukprot:6174665-Pleurochrysis_carterae.AAC.2
MAAGFDSHCSTPFTPVGPRFATSSPQQEIMELSELDDRLCESTHKASQGRQEMRASGYRCYDI